MLICPGTDSSLARLVSQALPLSPVDRAKLLESSPEIATAHAAAAIQGDTSAPTAEDSIDLHFVAFIKSANNNLWELDGRRKGPLNRGKIDEADDALSDAAVKLGVRNFLKREEQAGGGDLRFSLLALAPSFEYTF